MSIYSNSIIFENIIYTYIIILYKLKIKNNILIKFSALDFVLIYSNALNNAMRLNYNFLIRSIDMKIFDNPGKKLLGAVNIIFIICIVFAVIFGLITWVGVAASIGGAGGFVFGLIVAFLLVALVLFCAWLYLVTLAIFAKLHDDVHQLGSTVKKIEEKLSIEE